MVGIAADGHWRKSFFTVFKNTLSLRLREDQPLEEKGLRYE
jgi:hypothetical protein